MPAAEDVSVDMADGLTAVSPRVEDHSETVIESFGDCRSGDLSEQLAGQRRVRCCKIGDVCVVLTGNPENVGRSLRMQVPEHDNAVIADQQLGGNVTRRNPAEQAVISHLRHSSPPQAMGLIRPRIRDE